MYLQSQNYKVTGSGSKLIPLESHMQLYYSNNHSEIFGVNKALVNPQNFEGVSSFLQAVNFQPMWWEQIRHSAIVHA